ALSLSAATEKPVVEVTVAGAAESSAPRETETAADASGQSLAPEATPAPPSAMTAEERERARAAREEALRLAREEAALERATVPSGGRRRSSPARRARVPGRPPGSRPGAPRARRGSARRAAPVPMAELDSPAEETSVVQVTLGELREVDELTPEEEAVAAHPN